MEDEEKNNSNSMWVFALGVGVGGWLVKSTLHHLVGGFFVGWLIYFVGYILIWQYVEKYFKKKK